MKTKMISLLTICFFTACGTPKTDNAQAGMVSEATMETQKDDTQMIIDAYISLKDAFVSSNVSEAKNAAQALNKAINADKRFANLSENCAAISTSDDIAIQRENFFEMTKTLITFFKENQASQKLYVQFCPMAFDNAGATWISTTSEIRNPYFGEMMLKCGKVTEEL